MIKLEEEPTPPKAGRLVAGSPDVVVLGGLGGAMLLEELRRGQPRDDDRVRVPGGAGRDRAALVRRRRDGAAAIFDRYATLIRFENQALLNLAIRKLVYQRRGAIAHATLRAPGGPPDPGTLDDLDDLLRRTGLVAHLAPGSVLPGLLAEPATA